MAVASTDTGAQQKSANTGDRASVSADLLSGASAPSASASAQAQSVQAATLTAIEASAPTPSSAPSGAAGAPALAAAPMQDMIEAIAATIEIAARGGAAQARIALHPQELGHISIRISQTSDGLLARVTADTAAGAQALSESRAELHRSLSSLNLPLLRLDIGSSGQPHAEDRQGKLAGDAGGSGSTSGSRDGENTEAVSSTGDLLEESRPLGSPRGELVDVLA